MKPTPVASCIALFLLAFTGAVAAQQPQPSAERRQLEMFAGDWTYELTGELRGNGSWVVTPVLGGQFYRVSEVYRPEAGDSVLSMSIFGYVPERRAYSWHRFWSNGNSGFARGWYQDNAWSWFFDDGTYNGRAARWQLNSKFTDADHYTFTWRRSVEGGAWEVVGEGKATRRR